MAVSLFVLTANRSPYNPTREERGNLVLTASVAALHKAVAH